MQTSGHGGRDAFMMTVPIGILVVYGVVSGGGVGQVLHKLEVTLWSVLSWVVTWFS